MPATRACAEVTALPTRESGTLEACGPRKIKDKKWPARGIGFAVQHHGPAINRQKAHIWRHKTLSPEVDVEKRMILPGWNGTAAVTKELVKAHCRFEEGIAKWGKLLARWKFQMG